MDQFLQVSCGFRTWFGPAWDKEPVAKWQSGKNVGPAITVAPAPKPVVFAARNSVSEPPLSLIPRADMQRALRSGWSGMILRNSTQLDSARLEAMFRGAVDGWPREGLVVFVRYSRGADFSGTCHYRDGRIYINLGRHNRYPYLINTHVAKAESNKRYWWREVYSVEAADAYQLVLFVFMHEFYHWLVKKARRNVRQKEARCDRFAARALVDGYGAAVRSPSGKPVPRSVWDFQDLDGFVAAARRPAMKRVRRGKRTRPPSLSVASAQTSRPGGQLMLFGPEALGTPAGPGV